MEDESDVNSNPNPNDLSRYIVAQLQVYFRHEATEDIYQLVKKGSQFQRKVWEMVLKVPTGKTRTYQELAVEMGDIRQTRALATNPILILIHCHRVFGKEGKLRGYAVSSGYCNLRHGK